MLKKSYIIFIKNIILSTFTKQVYDYALSEQLNDHYICGDESTVYW